MSKKVKTRATGKKTDAEKGKPEKAASAAAVTSGAMDERQFLLVSKALADPTRMAVLRRIAKGMHTCSSVRDCMQVSAATLSHHMKELENAGIVNLSREGRFVHAQLDRKLWKRYIDELKSMAQ